MCFVAFYEPSNYYLKLNLEFWKAKKCFLLPNRVLGEKFRTFEMVSFPIDIYFLSIMWGRVFKLFLLSDPTNKFFNSTVGSTVHQLTFKLFNHPNINWPLVFYRSILYLIFVFQQLQHFHFFSRKGASEHIHMLDSRHSRWRMRFS